MSSVSTFRSYAVKLRLSITWKYVYSPARSLDYLLACLLYIRLHTHQCWLIQCAKQCVWQSLRHSLIHLLAFFLTHTHLVLSLSLSLPTPPLLLLQDLIVCLIWSLTQSYSGGGHKGYSEGRQQEICIRLLTYHSYSGVVTRDIQKGGNKRYASDCSLTTVTVGWSQGNFRREVTSNPDLQWLQAICVRLITYHSYSGYKCYK
jgi:hypothetical protein